MATKQKHQESNELKKILIIGSGGRENSIAWALSKNKSIEQIYVCPGNGGTANFEKCFCLKPKSNDPKTIIYDLIYNPKPTELLKYAEKKGCLTIDGTEMLIAQGIRSLEYWTDGLKVPFQVMKDALNNYL